MSVVQTHLYSENLTHLHSHTHTNTLFSHSKLTYFSLYLLAKTGDLQLNFVESCENDLL